MKKRRKSKPRPGQRHEQIHASPPVPAQPWFWKVLRSGWTKIAVATAILLGIPTYFGTFDYLRDLIQKPALTIHLAGESPNPFALPFKIKNEGHFTVRDLRPLCAVEKMQDKNGGTFENVHFIMRLGFNTIAPGDEKTAVCGIKLENVEIVNARIVFEMSYTKLWSTNEKAVRTFTWYADASPPRWVESD